MSNFIHHIWTKMQITFFYFFLLTVLRLLYVNGNSIISVSVCNYFIINVFIITIL